MGIWREAQQAEAGFWGDCRDTFNEEAKQLVIAKAMGLDEDYGLNYSRALGNRYDLKGKTVCDVGGGPASLLLKCYNGKRLTVVDPLPMPDWCRERYRELAIDLISLRIEDYLTPEHPFDEVWAYNFISHTDDPELAAKRILASGKVIRLCEWLDGNHDTLHPTKLTVENLEHWYGCKGRVETLALMHGEAGRVWVAVIGQAEESVPYHFHILGIAHTVAIPENSTCAYTQKSLRLSRMLTELGHKVYFYGVEGSTPQCTEFIPIVSKKLFDSTYQYDWSKEQYRFDHKDATYQHFNLVAPLEIKKRWNRHDFVLCPFGCIHWQATEALETMGLGPVVVESGIGYKGIFANFKVFESYAWMHYIYGVRQQEWASWYDTVIPNCYDPKEFTFGKGEGDYLLMMARAIEAKGIRITFDIAQRTGYDLIIAGQGNVSDFGPIPDNVQVLGSVGPEQRRGLMMNARALLAPTYYVGPFEGVNVEAQLSGTPVITTDWGAFAETVEDFTTGFRCRTMAEFMRAVELAGSVDRFRIRDRAILNYSLERGKELYQQYFENLMDVSNGAGFYEMRDLGSYVQRGVV